jgi:hypothetical protein
LDKKKRKIINDNGHSTFGHSHYSYSFTGKKGIKFEGWKGLKRFNKKKTKVDIKVDSS